MADDDGMLISFDLGTGPFESKQKLKGGSWRDRRSARKSTHGQRAKNSFLNALKQQNASGDIESIIPGERPVKRQRVNRDQFGHAGFTPNQREQPRQVISSLFSFNPEARSEAKKEKGDGDGEPAEPSNAPLNPELETFTKLGLSVQLSQHLLEKLKIQAPTEIQKKAITQLVKDDADVFVQAQTGSGKTLAYLLPIVQRLMASSNGRLHRDSGLFAIILAPTRELSKQISVVLESLLRCAHWIVSGTVIGGEKKKSEKARLRKGLNILIATPGRLADHLDHTEVLDVSNVKWLVLDEGDRLMELGFEKDVEAILTKLNSKAGNLKPHLGLGKKRTTILCSATMKMNVQKLGEMSLKDAVHLQAENTSSNAKEGDDLETDDAHTFSAPAQLQQSYAVVPAKQRLVALTAVLRRAFVRRGSVMKAIVFLSCADSVDFHFNVFSRNSESDSTRGNAGSKGPKDDKTKTDQQTSADAPFLASKENKVSIFRLHGSLIQSLRTSTLLAFKNCENAAILICTDVASRGLDLPNVDFVVEYDPAYSKDDHLHRVGRTARAGRDGRALIFLQPGSEEGYVEVLHDLRHTGGKEVTRNDVKELLKRGFGSPGIGAGKDWEEKATEWQLDVERWALEDSQRLEKARRAYQSHIRAYATHVAAERSMFNMEELHLGHLAKAFGLRDKPGSINVPGLRPNKSPKQAKAERNASNRGSSKGDASRGDRTAEDQSSSDTRLAAQKFREKLKQMGGASEFNLG